MPIRQDDNQPNRRFGIINLVLIGFGVLLLASSFLPSNGMQQVPRVPLQPEVRSGSAVLDNIEEPEAGCCSFVQLPAANSFGGLVPALLRRQLPAEDHLQPARKDSTDYHSTERYLHSFLLLPPEVHRWLDGPTH